MSSISFKASYKNTKRRFSLASSTPYSDFESNIASLFSLTPPFTIAYKDDENDLVSVSSDAELNELFTIASTANITPLRLHIYDAPDDLPPPRADPMEDVEDAPRPAPRPQQQPSDPAMPTLDGILSGVAHVLAAMRNAEAPPPFRGGRRGPPPAWGGPGRRGHCGHRGPRGPRGPGFRYGPRHGPPFGPFDGFGALISSFAPLFASMGDMGGDPGHFFSRVQDVSQQTKDAFHALTSAAMAADNRSAVMTSARNAFPIVHQWIRSNLTDGTDVQPGAVDTLVSSVQNAVGSALGPELTGHVTVFIRTAMNDPTVVDMLRQLPQDLPFDWEAEFRVPMGREAQGLGGFSVHRRVECDNCGTSPIVGSRFKATNRSNYDLCATCYNSDSVSKEGLEFKECKFVWQSDLGDAAVPPAPLSIGDRGPRIAFLQKILTDLGYMNENMYRRAVGMFGPNTRMAVLQFQREYGLTEVAEEGMYDATTAASLTSVLEAQVPPTAATGGPATESGPSSSPTADIPEPSPTQG